MAQTRARDLGIPLPGIPGPLNAITDVAGVEVGHATLIEGDGPARRRQRSRADWGHCHPPARKRVRRIPFSLAVRCSTAMVR